MDIVKLSGENILTLGEFSLELDSRGLLLIQGINQDDSSAESNGAGKSSIVDTLCWTIFGVTARGVTGDSIVNRHAKKNCFGEVVIQDEHFKYRIIRYRKHATHRNQVFVFQSSIAAGSTEIDLSKGTDKETQEIINEVMGCSLDVFVAAIYAGQEKMPDLPGMTDKQLKTLLEEAAGVEVLTSAYTVARNRLTSAKASLDASKSGLETVRNSLAILGDRLKASEANFESFESGRRDRAKAELAKVAPIKKRIEDIAAAIAKSPKEALVKEMEQLDEKLKTKRLEDDRLKVMNGTLADAVRNVAVLKSKIESGKRDLTKAETALADVDGQVGKPCGECGKTYEKDDLVAAREIREKAVADAKDALRPIVVSCKEAIAYQEKVTNDIKEFEATMTDFTEVSNARLKINTQLGEIAVLEKTVEGLNKEQATIADLAKAKLSETNPYLEAVKSMKAEMDSHAKGVTNYEEKVLEFEGKVNLLENAVKVFGPAGVRAHILDTVTPYLNDRTQDYLGAFSDGNIHAEWSTLSKTAKGELREKFNIEVTNDTGADSFAGLSGGEKRKVRLATAMALQDMVASRATKPINIFIADEVDHALDESGLERLMTVLERKARERGTVLVISHNSLADWCDQILTVTKTGGLARVSGATERGF